jgi:hypothetical protein
MSGADGENQLGVYGTLGVPAAGNVPGARLASAVGTDLSGNLWLFGGLTDALRWDTRTPLNDLWKYTPTTSSTPSLTTPAPGSTLSGATVTFAWSNPGSLVTQFMLRLGTTGIGSSDVYNGAATTGTTAQVSGIPANGAWLYARLLFYLNGSWQYVDAIYTEAGTPRPPALTTPAPGSTLSGSTVTFGWNPGKGPTQFELMLGTTGAGSSDVYNGAATTGTTAQVSGIPTYGANLYARLMYYLNGNWQYVDALYTEAGAPPLPALTTPAPGSTLSGSTVTFAWNPGQVGATRFVLRLGTTYFGTMDVYHPSPTTGTTAQVSGIPANGAYLYARLWYYVNGTWKYVDATYTESGTPTPPALTTPAPGSTLSGSTVTFGWSPGAGPTRYVLRLGTTGQFSSDVYSGPATTGASEQVTTVPTNGAKLYATLWYYLNEKWQYVDAIYTEASQ